MDQTAPSPLSLLRVGFAAGSIHDPAGKEGLAQLTAAMLAEAGTRNRSLPELMKAWAQTGAAFTALVDKERTTFTLSAPRQKAEEALELALEQLLEPGFRDEDFRRLKAQQLNALNVGLKGNNDEELGKLALESRIFHGGYAHPVLGTETGPRATASCAGSRRNGWRPSLCARSSPGFPRRTAVTAGEGALYVALKRRSKT